eukprot:SAG31_NODE_45879_length_257_cov_0.563291_1_plen_61_part_01
MQDQLVSGEGSSKLLEFQGYTAAPTLDEAATSLEESCEVIGAIVVAVTFLLLIRLVCDCEL